MKQIIFIGFLISNIFATAQSVTLVNCIDEGNNEQLKLKENLDANNYLLCAKSYNVDDVFNSPYVLYKIDKSGSTQWKKVLEKTDSAIYAIFVLNFFNTYSTYLILDSPYKIYTKLDNELVLHYNYISNYDSTLELKPNKLVFGIINSGDGSYKSTPFILDTLNQEDVRYPYKIIKCLVNKINDSIYQMGVKYIKETPGFGYILSTIFISFYTINIHSNEVIKTTYQGEFEDIYLKNQVFYASKVYSPSGMTDIYKFDKLGKIIDYKLITYSSWSPPTFIDNNESSKLYFTYNNKQNIYFDYTTLCSTDSNLQNQVCKDYNDSFNDSSLLGGVQELETIPYTQYNNDLHPTPLFLVQNENIPFYENSFKKTSRHHYFLQHKSGNDSSSGYNIMNVVKIDVENGNIEAEKDIYNLPYSYSDYKMDILRDDISPDNSVYIQYDSITKTKYNAGGLDTLTEYVHYHHLSLKKYDSNLNVISKIDFPDSILIHNSMYYSLTVNSLFGASTEPNLYKFIPVNYNGQFIVLITYVKIIGMDNINDTFNIRNKYFLVNSTTGEYRDMNLPDFLTERKAVKSNMLSFFVDAGNTLSIIDNDTCSGNNLDISIYKYNDIINSVKPIKSNTDFDFTVYPNPSNYNATIKFENVFENKNAAVRLIDVSGKMVFSTELTNTNNYTLDVSSFSNGIYFVQLQTAEKTITKKLEVIH